MEEKEELIPQWYVVHTYSGHENKVKTTIEKAVENRGMEDIICRVEVPTEDIVEVTKKGNEKIRQKKIFPSYVLVKMKMTGDAWYIVRNTKGVTGFVGPGSKPVPLSSEEVAAMGIDEESSAYSVKEIDFEVGDSVEITKGPFSGNHGLVEEIDEDTEEIKIGVDIFGRKTLVTLDLESIEKL